MKPGTKPKQTRIGEQKIMKNGLLATIVGYRRNDDIDVRFPDGVIVYNKTYQSFQKGMIGHPDCLHINKKKDRTGETKIMSNGMKATIINYRLAHDLDVQFEDGAIRKHCEYSDFCSGNIAHPNDTVEGQALLRLGEKRYMTCGLEATIVEYRSYRDIDIEFEDGSLVKHKTYGRFIEGSIAHPKAKSLFSSLQETAVGFYLLSLGFIKTSKGDLEHLGFGRMELDFYHPEKQIAIEVDGGVHNRNNQYERDIRKNKACVDNGIKLYRLRDKTLPTIKDSTSHDYILNGKQLVMGLIDCKTALDEILISNGFDILPDTIDYERDLRQIMTTHAQNYANHYKKKRIGEKVFHRTTNQYMTIIDYIDWHHITVQWDDGMIATGKNYGAFKRGEIQHPSGSSEQQANERLGEARRMHCGQLATIIQYRNAEDIDIEFEDKTVVTNKTYYNFTKGHIAKSNT